LTGVFRRSALLAVGAVAAAGCQPVTAPAPSVDRFPQALKGLGTEPFWSVEVGGGQLAWSSMETPDPRRAAISRQERDGVLVVTGVLDGRSVRGEFRKAACSDGMSDRRYPFALSLSIGQERFSGCAYPAGMKFPPE